MDISKNLKLSFNLIKNNKSIIIPFALTIIIPFVIIFLFLSLSGLYPLLQEINGVYKEFDRNKVNYLTDKSNINHENYTDELLNYFGKNNDKSTYNKQLEAYFKERGYSWNMFFAFLNFKNYILLSFCILVGFILRIYFTCMSFSMISLGINKEKMNLSNIISGTNKNMIKWFGLMLLYLIIFVLPLILLLVIGVMPIYFGHEIIGAFSLCICVIIYLVYTILFSVKLFFAIPALFFMNRSPISSINYSLKISKGNFLKILAIIVVITLVILFTGIGSRVGDSYVKTLFSANILVMLLYFIIFLVTLIASSVISAFVNTFIFYTFTDIESSFAKQSRSKVKKSKAK